MFKPALTLVTLVILFTIIIWPTDATLGTSSSCANGDCHFSAGSSLISVIGALLALVYIVLHPRRVQLLENEVLVGVSRRFCAFVLDYVLILLVISPLIALPILFEEAKHTGTFAWSFSRDFSRDSDTIYGAPLVFVAFAIVFSYFYIHARQRIPTLGQYAMGFVFVKRSNSLDDGSHAKRVIFSFIGLSMWPVTLYLALKNPRHEFWWDTKTSTRVVRAYA